MLGQNLGRDLVAIQNPTQLLVQYSGDLKSDHSKSRLFEGRISNGQALAMAVPTIGNQDIFVQISNGS